VAENDGAGAERESGGHGAGTGRRAGVTEIGWSVERLFRRSRALLTCSDLSSEVNNRQTDRKKDKQTPGKS